jgi:hypothetical protein
LESKSVDVAFHQPFQTARQKLVWEMIEVVAHIDFLQCAKTSSYQLVGRFQFVE